MTLKLNDSDGMVANVVGTVDGSTLRLSLPDNVQVSVIVEQGVIFVQATAADGERFTRRLN